MPSSTMPHCHAARLSTLRQEVLRQIAARLPPEMQLMELLQRCAGPQQRGALLEHSVGYSGVLEEEEETLRVSAAG